MKFSAAVGNPPYQTSVAKKETENGQKRSSSIFQYFQLTSEKIARYTSLIYPGTRWMHQSGKGMAQFGLAQINDPHLRQLEFFPDSSDIFTSASITDGISIVLKDTAKKTAGFCYIFTENGLSCKRMMENPGKELMTLNPFDSEVANCLCETVEKNKFTYLHDSVLSQKLFSIESDFVEANPDRVREYNEGDKFDKEKEVKLFTNDKSGAAGRSKWYIVAKSEIHSGLEYLHDWKVVVSSAHPGGQDKRDNQIAVIDNYSAFGRTRVALKTFKTEKEARNFLAYCKSDLIKFAFLLTDEALTSFAKRVPDIMDYSDKNPYIDFSKNIDAQLYALFNINETNREYIKRILTNKGK